MYKVTVDGITVHNPALNDPSVLIIGGTVKKQANRADTFEFVIYPGNVGYSQIQKLSSVVEVYRDTELIFRGRPVKSTDGWNNQRAYVCEGDFAYFNDTILRPYSFSGSVRDYLQMLVTQHNSQVAADKQFTLRTVTVTDPNNYIVRSNSEYVTTMQEIQEKLVGNLGGYMVTELSNNTLYLDYLLNGISSSSQKITVAKNLIDFVREQNAENIATALIPLGKEDEATGERLTIKSVNNGLDYITDAAAVARYGLIFTTEVWEDVTVAANLLTKAQARLSDYTALIPKLTLTTVDLSLTDQSIDPIRLLDYVTVEDDQHAASGRYLVSERIYNLSEPEKDQVTFGGLQKTTISGNAASNKVAIEAVEGRVLSASDRIRAILEAATGGNIYFVYDQNGVLCEIRIMDTDDPATATKIWRWNINGWGYSGDGGQTYTVAATMDGEIDASCILTGLLQSLNGKFYLDMETGEVRMASANITGGSINIQSSSDSGDIIQLNGPGSYAKIAPNLFHVQNTSSDPANPNKRTAVYGGGIYVYDTTNGLIVRGSFNYNGLYFNDSNGNLGVALSASEFYFRDSSQVLRMLLNYGGLYFRDSNGDDLSYLYADPSENAKLLGYTALASYQGVYSLKIGKYRGYILNACRGSGNGVMASVYIPCEQALLCTSASVETWAYSAQNGNYYAKCFFDVSGHMAYICASGYSDCVAKIYGIT